MRDPQRIDAVLEAIKEIWEKHPDLRLGQLIGNVIEGPPLYYTEDDFLVGALTKYYLELEFFPSSSDEGDEDW